MNEGGSWPGAADTCYLWAADLDMAKPGHFRLLDEREQTRALGYTAEIARRRFVLGAALLRMVASLYTHGRPGEVAIDRTCRNCTQPHGKPALQSRLQVSVTHSGEQVCVAAAIDSAIGVDLEKVRNLDLHTLRPLVTSADEEKSVHSEADLLRYWVRKEAALKATGDGLAVHGGMTAVVVSAPEESPQVLAYPGLAADNFHLYDFEQAGCLASVAVLATRRHRLVQLSGQRLLASSC